MLNRFILILLLACTTFVTAGELKDGILYADGKPFFPLAMWEFEEMTAKVVASYGFNTSFGLIQNDARGRAFMQDRKEYGLQVALYMPARKEPTDPDIVKGVAQLAEYGNILIFNAGDDLYEHQQQSLASNVSILRKYAPGIPIAADFWVKEPKLVKEFNRYVDINMQYDYPLLDRSFDQFRDFFAEQFARHGNNKPIWTYIQAFMWSKDAVRTGYGFIDNCAPWPEPEQVRLMAYTGLNAGLRGIIFFAGRSITWQPEIGAEVALTCHEFNLFNETLAAGKRTTHLQSNIPDLDAASFHYQDHTLVSACLTKDFYHKWVDEGVLENVTIKVPWTQKILPNAKLVDFPSTVSCTVSKSNTPGFVTLTIPRLELAGFILLSHEKAPFKKLEKQIAERLPQLAPLASIGAAAQARKANWSLWQNSYFYHSDQNQPIQRSAENITRISQALVEGNYHEAVKCWRESNRYCRIGMNEMMQYAISIKNDVPPEKQKFIETPHTLFNIPQLMYFKFNEKLEHGVYARNYEIAGPFRLGVNPDDPLGTIPEFFETAYAPEQDTLSHFETLDGPQGWRTVSSPMDAILNLHNHFQHKDDVVAYARYNVIAPEDMDLEMVFASNDGCRLWINKNLVHSRHAGHTLWRYTGQVTAHLHKGKNTILFKVENIGGNWRLRSTFIDPEKKLKLQVY